MINYLLSPRTDIAAKPLPPSTELIPASKLPSCLHGSCPDSSWASISTLLACSGTVNRLQEVLVARTPQALSQGQLSLFLQ